MKLMTTKDVDDAIKQIAEYYKDSRLYTHLFNTEDVYQKYIDEYTEDTKLIVEQGMSYKLKKEYLIALQLDVFEQEHPEAFHHYFDCIYSSMEPTLRREVAPVIFICAAGPSKPFFNGTTYKLVKEFVEEYNKDYTILTDCLTEVDFSNFARYTGSSLITCAGREYFRWPCRR